MRIRNLHIMSYKITPNKRVCHILERVAEVAKFCRGFGVDRVFDFRPHWFRSRGSSFGGYIFSNIVHKFARTGAHNTFIHRCVLDAKVARHNLHFQPLLPRRINQLLNPRIRALTRIGKNHLRVLHLLRR